MIGYAAHIYQNSGRENWSEQKSDLDRLKNPPDKT